MKEPREKILDKITESLTNHEIITEIIPKENTGTTNGGILERIPKGMLKEIVEVIKKKMPKQIPKMPVKVNEEIPEESFMETCDISLRNF